MANTRTYKQSFNGGEVSPDFWGQIGDGKYQSGVATMRNFIALPHGPAQNRTGTKFIREAKPSATDYTRRLIPFVYSQDQTYVVEVGDEYMRFHTNGATVLFPTIGVGAWSSATNYTQGQLVTYGGFTYYAKQASLNQTPALVSAYWYRQPTTGEYEIPSPIDLAEIANVRYAQSNDVLTMAMSTGPAIELRRYGATDWRIINVPDGPPISAPASVGANGYPLPPPATTTYKYVVTAVNIDGIESRASLAIGTCTNDLLLTGAYNEVTWSSVFVSGDPTRTGYRYNVYKESNGIYGYIGQAKFFTFIDDNIAPDLSRTIAIPYSLPGNPGAVTYFEQRRAFASFRTGAGLEYPSSIVMSRPGTENNFDYSLPSVDTDALRFKIASREVNVVQHMVPLQELIVLTNAAEWRVSAVDGGGLTPSTIQIKAQSYIGANNVQPVVVNNNILFAANRGGHVRELAYSFAAGGYLTGDLSLRSPHLFDGYFITDMTLQKAPQQVVWFCSASGKLLGLTYVPEQQLAAWHQHDTDGYFLSVCAVPEGNEDALYATVLRTINGQTKYYIERFASRQFTELEDAWFVDCGLSINNANTSGTVTVSGGTTWGPTDVLTITSSPAKFAYPAQTDVGDQIIFTDTDGTEYTLTITSTSSTTVATAIADKVLPASFRNSAKSTFCFARDTISGLSHLEGKTVSILGDGAVRPQRVVTGGTITLDKPVCKAIVGLPITADLQTLPFAAGIDNAFGQGRAKNVNRAILRVYRSSGIFVGPTTDKLTEAKQRTTEPYGSPPELKSDEVDVVLTPSWRNSGGQIYIRQADPLPLTVVSLTTEVSVGD